MVDVFGLVRVADGFARNDKDDFSTLSQLRVQRLQFLQRMQRMLEGVIRYDDVDVVVRNIPRAGVHLDPVLSGRLGGGRIDFHADSRAAPQVLEKKAATAAEIQNVVLLGDVRLELGEIRPPTELPDGRLPREIAVVVMLAGGIWHAPSLSIPM